MKIFKFGGTSVGSADRMKNVADLIINNKEPIIIVLSAMSGTTNKLVEISDYLYKKNFETTNELIDTLYSNYINVIGDLYEQQKTKTAAKKIIKECFKTIQHFVGSSFDEEGERTILAQGEIISTNLFHLYLAEKGIEAKLLSALDFMQTNENSEPDYAIIRKKLNAILEKNHNYQIFITQGFICLNANKEIDNLKRGGSDYTASIIGNCTDASEIQIWTDIDGIHNNDPRIVGETHSLERLSFDEAAELAYFGAKILHPTSILPAKFANIPVILKNTLAPDAPGTTITKDKEEEGLKAVAAKDNITMIKIKSGRMLLAYGFLRKVFEIFERHQTAIDMIATSEVGVSVTIDQTTQLKNIIEELKQYGNVSYKESQTIICLVGYKLAEAAEVKGKVFETLKNIPIQMISYGGSIHNISVLINTEDKQNALINLNKVCQ